MKLEFDRTANGGYMIDLKANSDFNLHLERMSNEEDVYIYVRGSSEGEYKFYKKVFGKVVDMDFDIPEAITPKYYRIKTSVAPTLCEVTGDVENVTGQEVKPEPEGGSNPYHEIITFYDDSDMSTGDEVDFTAKTIGSEVKDYLNGEFVEDDVDSLPTVKVKKNRGGVDVDQVSFSPVGEIMVTSYRGGNRSVPKVIDWKNYNPKISLSSIDMTIGYPEYIIVENVISGFKYKVLFV